MRISGEGRCFLLLQGPHGPFFSALGHQLRAAGARVRRVGFNAGDAAFWHPRHDYIAYQGTAADWPAACRRLIADHGVTDLVLYGDTRPVHAEAIAVARAGGIAVHCFEEGYLRPHWVTYERGGVNGHSRLMQMSLAQMKAALVPRAIEQPEAPARWGDMRQHIFWGALYHGFVLLGSRRYRNFRPHRALSVQQEFLVHCRRLLLLPLHRYTRMVVTWRIRLGGFPYHLVLMQLEHDSAFQMHSPYRKMGQFIADCIEGFARGAAPHHHLVFKSHPLEDGRAPLARDIFCLAEYHGVGARVHFVPGGKLAALLNRARSAVTVNSTAGQQVLWRGLPLKTLGASVYSKPEFVSTQSLGDFFAHPHPPDSVAYRDYRHYLLETSQIAGGYYSARGRREVLRQLIAMMLSPNDPYDALSVRNAAPGQQSPAVN